MQQGKSKSSVRIRKIWVNENSSKDQVTVQFAQLLEATASGNALVAVAQGTNFGPNTATALLSFARTQAEKFFGTVSADYSDQPFESWPEPTAFVEMLREQTGDPNTTLEISVVENFTQNPETPAQTPKINPSTGEELSKNGQPIYRHTTLATNATVERVFIQHDRVNTAATVPAEKKVEAAQPSELVV